MREDRFAKVFIGAWIVWTLVCLAILGGAVYVAIHFLAKVW